MNKYILLAGIISFVVAALLGPVMIPYLLRLKVGQTIRDDGPESHLKKNGTPTMGGVIFLISTIVASLFFMKSYSKIIIIPVLIMMVGFGLIGFVDDFIKVVLKRSMGLRAWQKFLLQFIFTCLFAWYMINVSGINLTLKIPFTGYVWDMGFMAIPLLFVVVLGTVNGANFTDGIDGLSASVTSVIAAFFAIASIVCDGGIEPVALAFLGGLLGYLMYNVHPAKVFMGDTGSLALGGFVASTAYMLDMPLILILIAFIYLIEILSVIIQVSYFKITHGKRVFRMAPIHHHFELGGMTETQVVYAFVLVTLFLSIIAYMGL